MDDEQPRSLHAMSDSENVTGQVTKRYEPTSQECVAVEGYFARKNAVAPSPRLKVDDEDHDGTKGIEVDHPEPGLGLVLRAQALGARDTSFSNALISQLANAVPKGSSVTDGLNFMLSVVKAVEPKNELESLLAAQMAAIHVATMHQAARLSQANVIQQCDGAERAVNKLARTFAMQIEALKRYRTGGEQKVTVEHVHVHAGAQAIVGHVEHKGEGGAKNNGSSPCANG